MRTKTWGKTLWLGEKWVRENRIMNQIKHAKWGTHRSFAAKNMGRFVWKQRRRVERTEFHSQWLKMANWRLCLAIMPPPSSSIFLHPPKCAYFRPPNSILEREAEPEKHKPKCPQISVTSNKYIHQTTVCWHPFSPFQQTGSILSSNGPILGRKNLAFILFCLKFWANLHCVKLKVM